MIRLPRSPPLFPNRTLSGSIVDSGDHASIMDGVAMARARIRPFRHNRIAKLEDMLERAAGDGGGVLVVVDGVFSMEGDRSEEHTSELQSQSKSRMPSSA